MTVKITVNLKGVMKKFSSPNMIKLQQFTANEIVTVTDPFVPFREGYLKNSATIAVDGSFIKYDMPYATRLYYNPQYKFNGAPQRGGEWVKRSMAINKNAIEQAMIRYAERL